MPDTQKYHMIPWDAAEPLHADGAAPIKGLVIGNMVYLDHVPQGTVHVAAVARRQTAASALQWLVRNMAPLEKSAAASGVTARYAVASTMSTKDGKAILHIPGVNRLSDLAYIGIEEAGKPLVWRRVTN